MSVALLVFGLIMFVLLVVVHEWGHYIAARRNNVDVEEFGLGFPPRAMKLKKRNGTLFTLNWLPLGGFVKLKGEHDADTEPGTYGAAPLKAKVKIMLAGVGMNLLVAFVLLTILALTGMPKILDNQFTVASDTEVVTNKVLVGAIEPDSPAAYAKTVEGRPLQELDRLYIISAASDCIGECEFLINTAADVPRATQSLAKDTEQAQIVLLAINDSEPERLLRFEIELRSREVVEAARKEGKAAGYLGVVPSEYTITRSTWSAPIVAVGFMVQATTQTLQGLGTALANLVTGNAAKASEQVSGPVGIFAVLQRGSELGISFVLLIIALISLTLAIMNALPIPALDGGRLFVTLLYRAMRKPLTPKAEERIHGTGFAVLMILFLLITIVDIRRL